MAAAPGALAEGSCAGEACAAIATSTCTITNKGDKAVQLTTIADQASLMMTVLAPGEAVKQDKALCEKFARGEAHYDARFAALRAMPEAPDFTMKTATVAKPVPKPKPAPATASVEVPTAVAPAVVAAAMPKPKPVAPPSYPPAPRAKPIVEGSASPTVAAAEPALAAPATSLAGLAACGEACATILFKVVDNCLWVVNLHPRAVAFEAEAAGKKMALMLEAADGDKADARSIALAKGQAPKDEVALHMRLHDPFQSAGSGIPIYRARLGDASACVKERSNVTRFSARFVN